MDWDKYKRKLGGDKEAIAEITRQQSQFEDRKAAVARQGSASADDIDWESYAEKLPGVDVAALKADFEEFLAAVPDITYDEAADAKEHAEKEENAARLQKLSSQRLAELSELMAEADDHKLHAHYSTNDLYMRHDGLHEAIKNEILSREYYKDLEVLDTGAELEDSDVAELKSELLSRAGLK